MNILFVHGMGRSPLSSYFFLKHLRKEGHRTHTFFYIAAKESVDGICERLSLTLKDLSEKGPYVVIGHSLGGVLLRKTLQNACFLLPEKVFLLGSPIGASRLAQKMQHSLWFQKSTGECGRMLSCQKDMAGIGRPPCPIIALIGTKGLPGTNRFFKEEEHHDGIVAYSESFAPWFDEEVLTATPHAFLPVLPKIADIVAGNISGKR